MFFCDILGSLKIAIKLLHLIKCQFKLYRKSGVGSFPLLLYWVSFPRNESREFSRHLISVCRVTELPRRLSAGGPQIQTPLAANV